MKNPNDKIKGPIHLPVETRIGVIEFEFYFAEFNRSRYIVLKKGEIDPEKWTNLRIESACIFGHVFGSRRCDCEFQLKSSIDIIAEKNGLIIYGIDDDGRGLGIEGHFDTYYLRQVLLLDTEEVYSKIKKKIDIRDYSDIIKILDFFVVKKIKLLTNNQRRIEALEQANFKVSRVSLETKVDEYNAPSLMDKKDHLHYLFSFKSYSERIKDLLKDKNYHEGCAYFMVVDDFYKEIVRGFPEDSCINHHIYQKLTGVAENGLRYLTLYVNYLPCDACLKQLKVSNKVKLIVVKKGLLIKRQINKLNSLGFHVEEVKIPDKNMLTEQTSNLENKCFQNHKA